MEKIKNYLEKQLHDHPPVPINVAEAVDITNNDIYNFGYNNGVIVVAGEVLTMLKKKGEKSILEKVTLLTKVRDHLKSQRGQGAAMGIEINKDGLEFIHFGGFYFRDGSMYEFTLKENGTLSYVVKDQREDQHGTYDKMIDGVQDFIEALEDWEKHADAEYWK